MFAPLALNYKTSLVDYKEPYTNFFAFIDARNHFLFQAHLSIDKKRLKVGMILAPRKKS